MNGALEILRRERDDAAEQIRALRVRIRDLDSAISVLEGQPVQTRHGRAPGDFKVSVLTRLKELGEQGGTPKELAASFIRDGRNTSDASVSSTLSRLKGESKVSNRNGRWFAVNSDGDSQTAPASELGSNLPPDWDDLDEVPF
jgi:hypothetical protein